MAAKKIDYKKLSAELDEVVARLQSADLDVDQAVQAYERGMAITKDLETYLQQTSNKVTKIKADWQSRVKQ
jgi:exodeoxyribonuclease VII small subunit